MKSNKQKILKYLILLLVGIIAIIPCKFIFSSAADTDEQYSLKAVLYDSAQYEGGTGTALTEAGAEVNEWQYNTSKYLQIDPVIPESDNTYTIKVELPQELYIVTAKLETPAGYKNVEFIKNEKIVINDSKEYELEDYSGTAIYTMNTRGVSGTIQLEIRYDNVLWNKQSNARLTPDGVNPIQVTLSEEDGNGTKKDLKKLSISKATAKSEIIGEKFRFLISKQECKATEEVYLEYGSLQVYASYYKEFKIVVQSPVYTSSSGQKYYLPFNLNTIKFPSLYYSAMKLDTSELSENGKITINLENVFFEKTCVMFGVNVGPLNSELAAIEQQDFQFSNGNINNIVTCKNGDANLNIYSANNVKVKYTTKDEVATEKINLVAHAVNPTTINIPKDVVQIIAHYHISNDSTVDSCKKTILNQFDTKNTNLIKVTTINTFADTKQEYINIKYTLVDDNGNRVYMDQNGNVVDSKANGAIGEWIYPIKNAFYGTSTKNNLFNTFSRSMLPENHRKYYFKSIEYTLNTIEAGASLWKSNTRFANTGAGNCYGYVKENISQETRVNNSLTIISPKETGIAKITANSAANLKIINNPAYGLENTKLDKTIINAGESVILTGGVVVAQYPYGSGTWLTGIRLGVVLPKDVSINEQSIKITDANDNIIGNIELSSKEVTNGNILWMIKLPKDYCIGYLTEELKNVKSGYRFKYSIQLDTSESSNNMTIFLKDIIYAAGEKQNNSAINSWAHRRTLDLYDVNENGSTTDYVAGIEQADETKCQIISQNSTLEVSDNVSVERQEKVTEETNSISLLNKEDIVNYNLDIKATSGGEASKFEMYIPIPKKTSTIDNLLIDSLCEAPFDFSVKNQATITGSNNFSTLYSLDNFTSYSNLKEITTWYTGEQIENDNNLRWEQVTAIKIIAKDGIISNGTSARISVQMKYNGELYANEAGLKNIWHTVCTYTYTNGSRVTEGTYQTEGVSVDIKYNLELEEITLTAAKDRTPQIDGNVSTKKLGEELFAEFQKEQTFSITGVELYNVNLETKEYIQENISSLIGADANKIFAITVSMNSGEEKSILDTAKTQPIQLGTTIKDKAPTFTFNIYNANIITENSQIRYVIVTLTSDNGVTIKQRININREVSKATDPKSAVISGKIYLSFDNTDTETTISQDSAFTSQFVVTYVPSVYIKQELSFSEKLPIGTNLILVNLSDENNPTYWYYKLQESKNLIDLTEFICMGTTQTNYEIPTDNNSIEQKLLVITDFSQCSDYLPASQYSLKMILRGGNTDIGDFTSSELNFITKERRTFTLNNDTTALINQEFTVNYEMVSTEGIESKYEGRRLALVFTATSEVPKDANLKINDETYYLNANNQFIIPLDNIQKNSDTLKIILSSNMLPIDKKEYDFNVALYVSATSNANAPLLGEKVGESTIKITTPQEATPSLKVTNMSKRIIHRKEISETLSVDFKYIESRDCNVTVELQQKIGKGYKKVTDKLNKVNDTTIHNAGVYDILAAQGENQISVILSSYTQNETYRLVFKVNDSNGKELLQIPYNLIVVD